jgi:peptidoglycan/LPS O-acetylase OafA/YrhL
MSSQSVTATANSFHTAAQSETSRFYRPELDVLRLAAFLLVFVCHAMPTDVARYEHLLKSHIAAELLAGVFQGGVYGVDLFFCLSSYLITTLLIKEHRLTGTIDVRSFYVRRILRIWPLYFIVLLCVGPLVSIFLPDQFLPWKYLAAFILLSGNWATGLWGFPSSYVSILWSVSIEEQFYLTWPQVMRRWLHHLPKIAWILIAVAFVTRAALVHFGASRDAIFCNTLARLDPIAAGALIGFALRGRIIVLRSSARALLILLGILGIALCGAFGSAAGPVCLLTYPAATLASVLLLLASIGADLSSIPSLATRPLVYLGRISYGLYVFHGLSLVITGAVLHAIFRSSGGMQVPCALALTILCATVSYRFLESPFLRLKERFAHIDSAQFHHNHSA